MPSQKKGNKKEAKKGAAKNYITRSQAVRKLQISLPDFRRLCIFKGIYPREPRSKKRAAKHSTPSTTFYYTRDISFLLHEPLLAKFRDHKALGKKISRALGRNEISDASRMEKKLTPRMTLDHVIKERYPTFVDALRDLDDCLSMLFLFANLPRTDTVPPKTIQLCQRLCLEFEHYLIRTNSLRKSFLSIKGIYYQATIQGQDILWLVPYKFVQRVTNDVDFRIMGTFVEFYTTLLGFVNFRLYTSIGLVYPPKFNVKSDEQGAELGAFTLEGRHMQTEEEQTQKTIANGEQHKQVVSEKAQQEADRLLQSQEEPPSSYVTAPDGPSSSALTATADDEEQQANDQSLSAFPAPLDAEADALPQPTGLSASDAASLFADATVWLSRETPRAPLEFLLRSFGCKRVCWDTTLGDGAWSSDEADRRITHQIVDRPAMPVSADAEPEDNDPDEMAAREKLRAAGRLAPGERVPGRSYIQPQWVWDCINAGKLLRTDLYAPGATLPPHLSPWVKARRGEYDPTKSLAEQEAEGEAAVADAEAEVSDDEEMEDEEMDKLEAAAEADADEHSAEEEDADDDDDGMNVELAGSSDEEEEDEEIEADAEFGGFDESDSDDDSADDAATQHQRELEAEARGQNPAAIKKAAAAQTSEKEAKRKEAAKLRKAVERKQREQDEEVERAKMMMTRRKRKTFEKMAYSNKKVDAEAEKLRGKRRKIERKGGAVNASAAAK